MHNLENKPQEILWRPELLSDEEMHECLKETCWTTRRAAYYVLGLKIPDLSSLEEEKGFVLILRSIMSFSRAVLKREELRSIPSAQNMARVFGLPCLSIG